MIILLVGLLLIKLALKRWFDPIVSKLLPRSSSMSANIITQQRFSEPTEASVLKVTRCRWFCLIYKTMFLHWNGRWSNRVRYLGTHGWGRGRWKTSIGNIWWSLAIVNSDGFCQRLGNKECQVQIIIIAYDIANIGIIRTGTHHYPSDQGISLGHGLLNNFLGYIGRSLMRLWRLWQWRRRWFVLKNYGEKNVKWLNLELTHCNLTEKWAPDFQ